MSELPKERASSGLAVYPSPVMPDADAAIIEERATLARLPSAGRGEVSPAAEVRAAVEHAERGNHSWGCVSLAEKGWWIANRGIGALMNKSLSERR